MWIIYGLDRSSRRKAKIALSKGIYSAVYFPDIRKKGIEEVLNCRISSWREDLIFARRLHITSVFEFISMQAFEGRTCKSATGSSTRQNACTHDLHRVLL